MEVPLSQLGHLEVVNSFLAELAVMSYEYGYSIDSPRNLAVWEAQFGDFFNCAQTAVDTLVSCSHEKWQRPTALTLLLPHGYDGAGPEHSSARIERFLQSGSDSGLTPSPPGFVPNWRVINPTTPANYFHALRRQMLSNVRIPLVVAAPKGLLRHPACVSSLADVDQGTRFQPLVFETGAASAHTVLFCSGKTRYDLAAEREARGLSAAQFALVSVEELLPFPYEAIRATMAQHFPNATRAKWCQEEHENYGPWSFVYPRFYHALPRLPLLYAGRGPSAAPANGVGDMHKAEVKAYYDAAFE